MAVRLPVYSNVKLFKNLIVCLIEAALCKKASLIFIFLSAEQRFQHFVWRWLSKNLASVSTSLHEKQWKNVVTSLHKVLVWIWENLNGLMWAPTDFTARWNCSKRDVPASGTLLCCMAIFQTFFCLCFSLLCFDFDVVRENKIIYSKFFFWNLHFLMEKTLYQDLILMLIQCVMITWDAGIAYVVRERATPLFTFWLHINSFVFISCSCEKMLAFEIKNFLCEV